MVRTFHNLPSWVNICCPCSTQETSWSCSLDMSVVMGKRCDHHEIVMREWHRDAIVMREWHHDVIVMREWHRDVIVMRGWHRDVIVMRGCEIVMRGSGDVRS